MQLPQAQQRRRVVQPRKLVAIHPEHLQCNAFETEG
jgi:hypothetical protein